MSFYFHMNNFRKNTDYKTNVSKTTMYQIKFGKLNFKKKEQLNNFISK